MATKKPAAEGKAPEAKPEIMPLELHQAEDTADVFRSDKPLPGYQQKAEEDDADEPLDGEGDAEAEPKDGDTSDGEDGSEEDDPEDDAAEVADELGEFKPEDAAKWDAKYSPGGELNLEAFSEEWTKNAVVKEDGSVDGKLSEETYKYLKTKGISKDVASAIIISLQNDATRQREAFYTAAGGKDVVDAAFKWAKGGGYDDASKARFNAAMKSRDATVIQEAIDMVVLKHGRANPKDKVRDKVSPSKDVAANSNSSKASGVKPYKDADEERTAFRSISKISRSTERDAALLKHRARVRAGAIR